MEYLFLIALGWFVYEFEPFKILSNYIFVKLGQREWLEYILGVFDCIKCATFWSALAWSWSFEKAVVASFLSFTLEMIYEIWSRKK